MWKTVDGKTFTKERAVSYGYSNRVYKYVTRPTTRNTYYQTRFAGDASYKPINSTAVLVKVQR